MLPPLNIPLLCQNSCSEKRCTDTLIRTLVNAYAEAGLGVSVATDGVVYETDVLAASNAGPYMYRHSRTATSSPSTRRRRSAQQQQQQSMMSIWGQRPVLVLVGIRLGIDCVNPVYYDAVKVCVAWIGREKGS